jgi:hypothetical protein
MKKQTGIWIDSTKAIIVTLQDGKKQLVKSNLIFDRVYHDQEGDKGSFLEVSTWTHKSPLTKEKTSNQHLFKDIISPLLILMNFTFWPMRLKQS